MLDPLAVVVLAADLEVCLRKAVPLSVVVVAALLMCFLAMVDMAVAEGGQQLTKSAVLVVLVEVVVALLAQARVALVVMVVLVVVAVVVVVMVLAQMVVAVASVAEAGVGQELVLAALAGMV